MMKILLFLLFLFAFQNVHAFQCQTYPDRTEIAITYLDDYNLQDHCEGGLENRTVPLLIVIDSMGGRFKVIESVISQVHEVVDRHKRLGLPRPTVLVFNGCMSACIPILADVYQLAESGAVQLIIDPSVDLGFHSASIHNVPAVPETFAYLQLAKKHGVSEKWIDKNFGLFLKTETTKMSVDDPRLENSGLVDRKYVREGIPFLIRFRTTAIKQTELR